MLFVHRFRFFNDYFICTSFLVSVINTQQQKYIKNVKFKLFKKILVIYTNSK
jgi:hypothetical protein